MIIEIVALELVKADEIKLDLLLLERMLLQVYLLVVLLWSCQSLISWVLFLQKTMHLLVYRVFGAILYNDLLLVLIRKSHIVGPWISIFITRVVMLNHSFLMPLVSLIQALFFTGPPVHWETYKRRRPYLGYLHAFFGISARWKQLLLAQVFINDRFLKFLAILCC